MPITYRIGLIVPPVNTPRALGFTEPRKGSGRLLERLAGVPA